TILHQHQRLEHLHQQNRDRILIPGQLVSGSVHRQIGVTTDKPLQQPDGGNQQNGRHQGLEGPFDIGGNSLGQLDRETRTPEQAHHLGRENAHQYSDQQALSTQVGQQISQRQLLEPPDRYSRNQEQH